MQPFQNMSEECCWEQYRKACNFTQREEPPQHEDEESLLPPEETHPKSKSTRKGMRVRNRKQIVEQLEEPMHKVVKEIQGIEPDAKRRKSE